jgi:hypothetical protein
MYYSFKNLPIKINGVEILTSAAELSWQNHLDPQHTIGNRGASYMAPGQGVDGLLRLNYYITGYDYLKTFLNNDTGYLSGNIGGLYFNSGLIKTYNFACNTNAAVTPAVEISFFEEVKGSFASTPPPPNTGYNYLNFSDVTLNGLPGFSTEMLSAISSITFNYLTKITPYYDVRTGDQDTSVSMSPNRILCSERQLSTEIICNSLTNNLSFSGSDLGVKLTLGHPSIPSLNEYFLCSGRIMSKNISSSDGSIVKTSIGVIQYETEEDPIITGLWSNRWPPEPRDYILISGRNLTNTNYIWAQDREIDSYKVLSDTLVSGTMPDDVISGLLTIYTNGGKASFPYPTAKITPGVTHVRFSYAPVVAVTGRVGEILLCSGTGLSRTTGVYFASTSLSSYDLTGGFRYVGDNLIYIKLPTGAFQNNTVSPRVRFYSQIFDTFASTDKAVTYSPVITGFSPSSGLSGASVTIFGSSFDPGTAIPVYFNGILSHSSTTAADSRSITTIVPTGNVYGYITVANVAGNISSSSSRFLPVVSISGLAPASGRENDNILISGQNFQSGLMYGFPDGKFKVGFGSQVSTGFSWISNILLSGFVPSGATTSQIYIYANDGSTMYNSPFSFTRRYPAPSLSRMVPNPAISGQTYYGYVEGANLFAPSLVHISGLNNSGPSANTGTYFLITGSNLIPDVLGRRINIFGYTGFRGPTGNQGTLGVAFSGAFRVRVVSPEGAGTASTIFKLA